ncbi:MAG: type II toxin-antitoxin system VapC family toxin [Thermomicrobiales bacterium]
MNTPVIVDTSGLISLVSFTDSNHARALAASDRLLTERRPLIISGEVFTETVNTLGKKTGHETADALGRRLIRSGEFVLVETTPAFREAALGRFAAQPGGVSLTDCFVMTLADHFQTKEIFGFDDAFRKNGYRLPAAAAERREAA